MIVSNHQPYRHAPPRGAASHAARKFLILLILVYAALSLTTMPTKADERILKLSGPTSTEALASRIDFYLDADWSRSVAGMAGPDAGSFEPLTSPVPDFGYTKSAIWLRLRVQNVTDRQSEWVLYFRENFKQVFEVHVVDADGNATTAIKQNRSTGFDTRPIQYPELAAPFVIQPGQSAVIFVRYWSEGASYLPIQIETPTSFSAISAKRTAKNFLYYGMMFLLIACALVALVIFRHGVFLAYVAYSGSALVFLMHADGVAFQLLWPQFPGFNSVASVATGSGIIISGAIYARVFLKTRRLHPFMDKLLLLLICGTLAIDVASFFLDNQPIKRLLVLVALSATIIFTLSGLVAARTRFKEVRFFVLAWLGAVMSALLMTARHWIGIEVSQDFQYDSMRMVMVFDASMMGLAIVDRYNQMRASRQAALRANLSQTQRNLELSARLQELERQFSLADEIARSQDDALKDTIHDLRQPLHALRLRIHGMLQGDLAKDDDAEEVEGAFRYMETLVNERLASVGDGGEPTSSMRQAAEPGAVSLQDTLTSVHAMFLPDAEAKGLRFKLAATTAETAAPALALMRVLSNIVANAINYTDAGGVLLGARRIGGDIRIEVHDLGPGMSAEDFARAQGRSVRLESGGLTEGHGLGLAIAKQICDREGWRLELCSRRSTGSGVLLTLPSAIAV